MIALATASFLVFGVVLVLVGANQPALAAALDLDLAASGLLAAALSIGLSIGVVGSGPLVDRLPRRGLFLAASLVAATGLLSIDVDMGYTWALLAMGAVGIGAGGYETLLNTVIAERYGARAARPLAAVHCAATVGAALGPAFVRTATGVAGWAASFHWTGFAFLALGAWAAFARFPPPQEGSQDAPAPWRALSFALVPFAAVAACYVGVEMALTLFAHPYASDALALPDIRGAAAISSFWLGLFLGRVAIIVYRGPIDARVLLGSGLAAAAVLAIGTGLAVPTLELFVAAVGLLLGSVFPVMVALTAARFPAAPGTATGLVVGAGGLGGLLIPWLTGVVGDGLGVATAVASLSLWCVALAAAALWIWTSTRD